MNVKKVGIVGIIGNVFLFCIKIVVGMMGKSQSLIADAFNSAGDIFASFMTWLGNKISSVPGDDDHNYGHGKADYIFSMLISISMMIVSIKLFYDSLFTIINGSKMKFSYPMVIVCAITLIVKLIMYLYSKMYYKKEHNLLIKSNMLDHRNDLFITTLTLIAIILSKYNIYFVDGIVGLIISVWILITSIKIYKESYDVLMDSAIDGDNKKKILNLVKEEDFVKKVESLYTVPIGSKYIVILVILVDGNMTTDESHLITERIENKIINEIDIVDKVIVHVEPYENV